MSLALDGVGTIREEGGDAEGAESTATLDVEVGRFLLWPDPLEATESCT